MADAPGGETPAPSTEDDPHDRGAAESIIDYRAAAFLFVLFFLAIGLMYLIAPGRP
jgi:hypothetical protein